MIGGNQQAPPPYPGQGQVGQPSLQQPSTPIFVAPPPKPQRLLHSEAYLRYMEGLNAESATVSKWDQTLSGDVQIFHQVVTKSAPATLLFNCSFLPILSRRSQTLYMHYEESVFFFVLFCLCATSARRKDVRLTKEQESRLPSHWLKSKGAHNTMADALWRLRDLMLRDTLNIRHTYNIQNI